MSEPENKNTKKQIRGAKAMKKRVLLEELARKRKELFELQMNVGSTEYELRKMSNEIANLEADQSISLYGLSNREAENVINNNMSQYKTGEKYDGTKN